MSFRAILVGVLFTMALGLTGCTTVRVSTNYTPSILLEGTGHVNIENFTFSPDGYTFDSNENCYVKVTNDLNRKGINQNLQINQIELSTGTVLLDKSVSAFITEAVKKELKYILISTDLPLTATKPLDACPS